MHLKFQRGKALVCSSLCGMWLHRPNLLLHNEDGAAFLARRAQDVTRGSQPPIDLLFLDVFDGADDIPPAFTQPGMRHYCAGSAESHSCCWWIMLC